MEDHLAELPTKTMHSGIAGEGVHHDPTLYRYMPAAQSDAYRRAMNRNQSRQKVPGGALKTLQHLRSISLHPMGSDGITSGHSAPEDSARRASVFDIISGIHDRNEKVIVFVINKAVQRALATWLHKIYGIHVHIVNGETKAMSTKTASSRKQLIRQFQYQPGFGVIIMSPLAAGTGLTVTEANHAIHAERHWNPAKEAQATDRIYRIGQTKDVHVYLPLAVHPDPSIPSFDVNLHSLLQQKSDLKDAAVVPQVNQNAVAIAMGIT